MKLRYYYNLLRGKTKALNPAKLDRKHIWAVIQSWFRSILPTPKHIKEQIIWRRGQVALMSPECWKNGSCIQCGCEIVPKTTADMGCENEPYCYPEMMKKKQWEWFKESQKIKLFI
jgi:hypothetical protein